VIHCDLNDQNVLVDEASEHIVGVIDFGDLVYSWQVNTLSPGPSPRPSPSP
jgi:Ser/Thr protein kinase RdoA (MazF antagonist)